MKKFKLIVILISAFIFLDLKGAQAVVPYRSYIYDYWGRQVPASHAYLPGAMLSGADLGVGGFRTPRDVRTDSKGNIYLLDSGNNRIIILDDALNLVTVLEKFLNNGEVDGFNNPHGLYVTAENELFVADSGNGRILRFNADGDLLQVFGPPTSEIAGVVPDGFVYQPRKIGVDPAGRIFVVARDVYEGLMSFDATGRFQGYIGAPKVAPSLAEIFWSKIQTRAQRSRRVRFLPTEFSSLDLDERGFIYTTIASERRTDTIMRLNPAGVDILRRDGYFAPTGEIPPEVAEGAARSRSAGVVGPLLVDIAARSFAGYTVLDRNNGKLFTYDENGNLLYAFGTQGRQLGTFQDAVAVTTLPDERILVLDAGLNVLQIFEPTEYGKSIHAAIDHYNGGNYDQSTKAWETVLAMNVNFDLAYGGIGRAYFMSKEYEEAMKYFKLANDRKNYSKAFQNHRRQVLENIFGFVALWLLALIIFLLYRMRQRSKEAHRPRLWPDPEKLTGRQRLAVGLRYALYVIVHPFDGFWDLKHEKRGSVYSASVILLLAAVSYVALRQYTGFLFNYNDPLTMNIYVELSSVLIPFILYTGVNWAATTLLGGKGTLKDIYITAAYALTPLVLILVPATILSNYLILAEGAIFHLLTVAAVIWSLGLAFIGTMVIHDYTVSKNALMTVISGVGVGVVIFLALLGVSIIAQLSSFVLDVYQEIAFRL